MSKKVKNNITNPPPPTTSAGQILKNKIDIKGGKLLFEQRIDLGKIFQDTETAEIDKFDAVFKCLHGYKPAMLDYKKLLPYFFEIVESLRFWIETENEMLKYEPTNEELQAGIKELAAKIGEFGTIKSLAKNYATDPDTVLRWEYGKVFGILYTDLEEYKFQKKYNKIIENKYKSKK
ncbi:hypothetical protein FACS189434_09350 [Bacteroidia bacterium]|nr:hypothetical protein FACS189434_09350 [Bacteroidia bacterium]